MLTFATGLSGTLVTVPGQVPTTPMFTARAPSVSMGQVPQHIVTQVKGFVTKYPIQVSAWAVTTAMQVGLPGSSTAKFGDEVPVVFGVWGHSPVQYLSWGSDWSNPLHVLFPLFSPFAGALIGPNPSTQVSFFHHPMAFNLSCLAWSRRVWT